MDPTDLANHPFEIQVHDLSQGLHVIAPVIAKDLFDSSLPVDQSYHLVLSVRHVPKPLAQHLWIDLEHRVERRKLLGQPTPFVEPTHPFHQERLRRAMHGALTQAHAPELEVERAITPKQVPIDCVLADQFFDRGVDHGTRIKGDHSRLPIGRHEGEDPRLPAHVDRLQQIDHAHLREGPAKPRPRVAALVCKPGASLPRELDSDASNHLANVNRLGEVVFDAELEPANLAFDRPIARQKHERDMGPLRFLSQLLDELEAVQVAEGRVGEDQIRPVGVQDLQGLPHAGTPGHVVARVPEAHLEHSETTGVGIDDEEILLGHCTLLSAGVCEWGYRHVKHAFAWPT